MGAPSLPIRLLRLPFDFLLLTWDYLRIWYWLTVMGLHRAARVWFETFGPYRCGLDTTREGTTLCTAAARYANPGFFHRLCPGAVTAPEIDPRPLCSLMPVGFGLPWARILIVGVVLLAIWGALAGAALWLYVERFAPAPAADRPAPGQPAAVAPLVENPGSALVFLKNADRLYADGAYREALIQYRNAAQHDSASAAAQAGMGRCYMRLEQFAAAERAFRSAYRLGTERVDPLVDLGQIVLALGRVQEAAEWAVRALQRDPRHPRALLLKAEVLLRGAEPEEAQSLVTAALARPDTDPEVVLWGAKVAVKAGDPARAQRLIEQVLAAVPDHLEARIGLASVLRLRGRLEAARQELDAVLAVSPVNPKARVEMAELQVDRGALERAVAIYRDLAASRPQFYAARARMADLLFHSGRVDEAHEAASALVAEQAGSVRAHLLLANIYAGRELYSLAIPHCRAVLNLVPRHNRARQILTVSLAAGRNYDDALEASSEALAKTPDDLNWRLLRGRLYMSVGDADAARADFRAAAAAHADTPLPHLFEGQLWLARGEDKAARDSYEAALAVAPGNFTAANNLAALLLDAGTQVRRAYELARDLYARNPLNPVAADTLGWAAYRLGRLDEAQQYLSLAARQMPNHPTVRYHYGQLLWDRGERAAARRELEAALSLAQDFRGRERAVALLARAGGKTAGKP